MKKAKGSKVEKKDKKAKGDTITRVAARMGVTPEAMIEDMLKQVLIKTPMDALQKIGLVKGEPKNKNIDVEAVKRLHVRSETGDMVPVGALVKTRQTADSHVAWRHDRYLIGGFTCMPAPGYSVGEATRAVKKIFDEHLPKDYTLTWLNPTWFEVREDGIFSRSSTGEGLFPASAYLRLIETKNLFLVYVGEKRAAKVIFLPKDGFSDIGQAASFLAYFTGKVGAKNIKLLKK